MSPESGARRTVSGGVKILVGVSLLTKTVFQSMHFRRSYSPLREQVRSHGLRPESIADLYITMSDLRPLPDCRSGADNAAIFPGDDHHR
ncbi:hypothetical protein DA456_22050 [Pseudomonas syringae pv. atrofaciens]|uniref:Uncharacterized protein n=1 Tax=Pseudomonas syringae pv. atrofaciens TaxID=192087 RepID=A0AAD0ICF0_PSESX|nr:hypothetical protein DA456_22050 [Pseudomonas syringae pv. atrofaciens]